MIKKSFNSLLSSTPLPILVLTAFVCLIILPSDVICSTKMHKEKSCTVVHYFASTETFQQLILWKRKKKHNLWEIQQNNCFYFICEGWQLEKIHFISSKPPERLYNTATISKTSPFMISFLAMVRRKDILYFVLAKKCGFISENCNVSPDWAGCQSGGSLLKTPGHDLTVINPTN